MHLKIVIRKCDDIRFRYPYPVSIGIFLIFLFFFRIKNLQFRGKNCPRAPQGNKNETIMNKPSSKNSLTLSWLCTSLAVKPGGHPLNLPFLWLKLASEHRLWISSCTFSVCDPNLIMIQTHRKIR